MDSLSYNLLFWGVVVAASGLWVWLGIGSDGLHNIVAVVLGAVAVAAGGLLRWRRRRSAPPSKSMRE